MEPEPSKRKIAAKLVAYVVFSLKTVLEILWLAGVFRRKPKD